MTPRPNERILIDTLDADDCPAADDHAEQQSCELQREINGAGPFAAKSGVGQFQTQLAHLGFILRLKRPGQRAGLFEHFGDCIRLAKQGLGFGGAPQARVLQFTKPFDGAGFVRGDEIQRPPHQSGDCTEECQGQNLFDSK